jgi:hypothetical protein
VFAGLVVLKVSIQNVLHLLLTIVIDLNKKRALVIQWLSCKLIQMVLGSTLTFTINLENINQNNKYIWM